MTSKRYPALAQLLGAYFHQDCYMDGDDDDAILAEYVATQTPSALAETVSDIERFMEKHPTGLLTALNAEFQPDVTLGETDAETKAWLLHARDRVRPR